MRCEKNVLSIGYLMALFSRALTSDEESFFAVRLYFTRWGFLMTKPSYFADRR
jgi:hypothetical protein